MIVGIDGSVAVTPPLSGVGYHIVRLLESLEATTPPEVEFRVFYTMTDRGQRTLAERLLPESRRTRHVPVRFLKTALGPAHRFYWRVLLPMAIRRARCDLFHGPAHLLPDLKQTASVVTIHDLAFFDHELYSPSLTASLRQAVLRSMTLASTIIALSHHTKSHIATVAGRSENVRVIYGAGNYPDDEARVARAEDRAALSSVGVRHRYVLYVGDFNPRKNLPYLVESFGVLRRQSSREPVQLVLVGNSKDAKAGLETAARSAGLNQEDVLFPGRVSDELLRVLYRNASAFSLCSILEGFTLVTLEAMGYGVPVVATNTSSIAEGTGDAAELVPLDNPDAVARGLAVALEPGRRRDAMIRGGLERSRQFTWQNTARQTLDVYAATVARAGSSVRTPE